MSKLFHNNKGPFTVAEIATDLGLKVVGNDTQTLTDVASLSTATQQHLSFLDNEKYVSQAGQTNAGAVILAEKNLPYLKKGVTALISPMPYADYAKALQMFYPTQNIGAIHPTAVVDETAKIGQGTSIGANTYIGAGVVIGDNCQIASGVNIVCTHMGDGCIIHAGTAIGQDGFGFAYDGKTVIKVPQIGMVKIGDYVEIGANVAIDRGSLENTEIGSYAKIDNLVQIAHNVKIGEGCQIVSQTGIAGSTNLGKGVILGGQSGIVGHIHLGDGVVIAARSGVTKNINEAGTYAGFPAVPMNQWRKVQAAMARLVRDKLSK